eukprot:1264657-Amphidinium_carterae.1
MAQRRLVLQERPIMLQDCSNFIYLYNSKESSTTKTSSSTTSSQRSTSTSLTWEVLQGESTFAANGLSAAE